MKHLIVLLITFSVFKLFAQNDSVNFEITDVMTKDTLKTNYFLDFFNDVEKGVIFFYPNNKLKDSNDVVIKAIASNERFKNSKILAIPCEKTMNDRDNVHFEEYNVSNIQCILYGSPGKDLYRALEGNSAFRIIDSVLPEKFHLLEIDKEIICVNKDRVMFHEDIIYDYLDPRPTTTQQLEDLNEKVNELQNEIDQLKRSHASELDELRKTLSSLIEKLDNEQQVRGKKK